MKKNKEQIENEQVVYFNRIVEYVRLEYSDELANKINQLKYFNIAFPYAKNCYSLKKTIPYAAHEIVRYVIKTK
jgi:hypothetical protein